MSEIKKDNPNMEFPLQIARQYPAPLDKSSVFYSLKEAENYAENSPIAYVGQMITVVDEEAQTVEIYKIIQSGTQRGLATSSSPSDATPLMDGTASAGTESQYARGDHRHPSDTNKVNKSGDTLTGPLVVESDLSAKHFIQVDKSKDYVAFKAGDNVFGVGGENAKIYRLNNFYSPDNPNTKVIYERNTSYVVSAGSEGILTMSEAFQNGDLVHVEGYLGLTENMVNITFVCHDCAGRAEVLQYMDSMYESFNGYTGRCYMYTQLEFLIIKNMREQNPDGSFTPFPFTITKMTVRRFYQ